MYRSEVINQEDHDVADKVSRYRTDAYRSTFWLFSFYKWDNYEPTTWVL